MKRFSSILFLFFILESSILLFHLNHLVIACLLLSIIIIIELILIIFYLIKDEEYLSVKQKLKNEIENSYLTDDAKGFSLHEIFFPHPYLGHVQHNNHPAGLEVRTQGRTIASRDGFQGPDFPFKKVNNLFTLMVTGGSVAERFAANFNNCTNYLQQVLDKEYAPPAKKQGFLVLNGAMGAWKQPQQLFQLILHLQELDAAITLDGYNELQYLAQEQEGQKKRFEYPWCNVLEVKNDAKEELLLIIIKKIYLFSKQDILFSHSKLLYFIGKYIRDKIYTFILLRKRKRSTSLESIFAGPINWPKKKYFNWGLQQYIKYIRLMNCFSPKYNVKISHFIQPCSAIGKQLTKEEEIASTRISSGYAKYYLEMESSLLALRNEGIHIHSLLYAFQDIKETIYRDDCHVEQSSDGISKGNEVLAKLIAAQIAKDWNIKKRI